MPHQLQKELLKDRVLETNLCEICNFASPFKLIISIKEQHQANSHFHIVLLNQQQPPLSLTIAAEQPASGFYIVRGYKHQPRPAAFHHGD